MHPITKSLMTALSLGVISASVHADTLPFLKQDKQANHLGLFVWVSEDCSITENGTIQRAVQELSKANITATEDLALNLTINVDCMPILNENDQPMGISTYIETRWGTQLENGYNVLYEEPNYGSYMISSADQPSSHYFDKIAESIQEALQDYKKANAGTTS